MARTKCLVVSVIVILFVQVQGLSTLALGVLKKWIFEYARLSQLCSPISDEA
jgi:hypothetical protein